MTAKGKESARKKKKVVPLYASARMFFHGQTDVSAAGGHGS
jgi:hypothetical protein